MNSSLTLYQAPGKYILIIRSAMSRTYVAEADVLVVRSTRNLRRWDWELYTVWRDENA